MGVDGVRYLGAVGVVSEAWRGGGRSAAATAAGGLRGGSGGDAYAYAYCRGFEGDEDEEDAEESEGAGGLGLAWARKGFDEIGGSDACISGSVVGGPSDSGRTRLGPGVDRERVKGLADGVGGAARGGKVGVVADVGAFSVVEGRGGGGGADFVDAVRRRV
jgi:hypothetical protein